LVIGVVLVIGAVVSGAYYGAIIGVGVAGRSAFALYAGQTKALIRV